MFSVKKKESLKKYFAPRKLSHTKVLVNVIQGTRVYTAGSKKCWFCPYGTGIGNMKNLRVRMVVDSSPQRQTAAKVKVWQFWSCWLKKAMGSQEVIRSHFIKCWKWSLCLNTAPWYWRYSTSEPTVKKRWIYRVQQYKRNLWIRQQNWIDWAIYPLWHQTWHQLYNIWLAWFQSCFGPDSSLCSHDFFRSFPNLECNVVILEREVLRHLTWAFEKLVFN